MVEGEVDELLADAWPAVETELVGRWRMRWSGGVTRRANSVLAVDGAGAIEERIARVDAFYAAHNVPPRYLVSSAAAPPGLSALLSRRGYRSIAPTFVQCAPAATVVELTSVPAGLRVESASSASDEWFSVFA